MIFVKEKRLVFRYEISVLFHLTLFSLLFGSQKSMCMVVVAQLQLVAIESGSMVKPYIKRAGCAYI